ncbi:alpha/beta hydrolase family protein [Sphingorhabdus sp. SMR4y]|uniref:alpha/beta hydrolase family protein n=1 Tax=Sphingorhabdus sp. SMR4y TaxID=2584094 RepID=UPI000B5F314D|nr:alpha/beta fold hydrolase [Sphingorhabdus sp. SMR4y]ASK89340.1 serine aminopeptidase, S33 [Sphingorhabdus sp. SMR4y]
MTDTNRTGKISQLSLIMSRRAALVGFGTIATAAMAHQGGGGKAVRPSVRLTLASGDGREIPVFDWTPSVCGVGTILFSHGAASSPDKYLRLIEPWVAQGWRVLAPLHVDSRDHPETEKFKGLASWKARLEDIRALSAYLGANHYVAAGHSYGGLVALTLGGSQAIAPDGLEGPLGDDKVQAVIALSPPAPIPVLITRAGYGTLSVPALIQTGTRDIVPGMSADSADGWKGHLVPFEAAAAGGQRYGLVLEGVDHYFGGAICDFEQPGPPQLAQLDAAVHLSDLFLQAHGLGQNAMQRELKSRITDQLPARLFFK